MSLRASPAALRLLLPCAVLVCLGGCCMTGPSSQPRYYNAYELMPPRFDNSVACPLAMADPCMGYRQTCWRSMSPCCSPCCSPNCEPGAPVPCAPMHDPSSIPPSTIEVVPAPVKPNETPPSGIDTPVPDTPPPGGTEPLPSLPSSEGASSDVFHDDLLPEEELSVAPLPPPPTPPPSPDPSTRSAIRLLAAYDEDAPPSTIHVANGAAPEAPAEVTLADAPPDRPETAADTLPVDVVKILRRPPARDAVASADSLPPAPTPDSDQVHVLDKPPRKEGAMDRAASLGQKRKRADALLSGLLKKLFY